MHRRLVIAFFLAMVLVALVAGAVLAQGPATKQVGLVVGLPEDKVHLEMVTVPMTATTFDVLKAAKIVLISQNMSFGPAICSINDVGCPATNCFCDPTHFWAYFHLDPATRTWTPAVEGAAAFVPDGGAVEGFVWSGADASFNPTAQPPVHTYEEIARQKSSAPVSVPASSTVLLLGIGLAGLAGLTGYALYTRARRSAR